MADFPSHSEDTARHRPRATKWSKMGKHPFHAQGNRAPSKPVDMVVSALASGDVINFSGPKGFRLFADKTKFFNNGMDQLNCHLQGRPAGGRARFCLVTFSASTRRKPNVFNAEVKRRNNTSPVG